MEEGRQDNAKYKRLSIQGETSTQVGREVCGTICDRRGDIGKCSEITITKFDENSPGSKYKPSGMIQETGKRTKEGRGKTSGSRKNGGMGSRKNSE